MKNSTRSKICRLCLNNGALVSLMSYQNGIRMCDMLAFCCSIRVDDSDGLTKKICDQCIDKLKISFNFKIACTEANFNLKSIDYFKLNGFSSVVEKLKNASLYVDFATQTEKKRNIKKPFENLLQIENGLISSDFTIKEECDAIAPKNSDDSMQCFLKPKVDDWNENIDKSQSKIDQDFFDDSLEFNDGKFLLENDSRGGCDAVVNTEKQESNRSIENKRKKSEISSAEHFNGIFFKSRDKGRKGDALLKKGLTAAGNRRKQRLTKYVCEKCGYAANDKTSLGVHYRSHTGERPYICTICNKSFAVGENLKAHMRRHNGEKQFVCHSCGKAFVAMSSLSGHLRTHSGEKPYECHACGRRFALRSNMLHHAKIHSNDRPYGCKVCEKRFVTRSDLTMHKRRKHTNDRPYTCATCGRQFVLESNLAAHTRVHTGQRDHCCALCGRSYINKASLKVHIKAHHSSKGSSEQEKSPKKEADGTSLKPNPCEHCEKRFVKKSSLKSHMRKHGIGDATPEGLPSAQASVKTRIRVDTVSPPHPNVVSQLLSCHLVEDRHDTRKVQALHVVSVNPVMPIAIVQCP